MKIASLSSAALLVVVACSACRDVSAAIIGNYDLRGSTVQNALHFLNEPAVASGGTGGELGLGIQLDDNGDADPNTNTLIIAGRIGWGSSQGFIDLTSGATNSHIHGPTAGNNGGGGFTQTAGVLFNLTRSSSLMTGGQFTNNPAYTAAQVVDLNNGKHYINLHTSTNPGGEIRGFIVPSVIPEPSSVALLVAGCACVALRNRKRL